MKMKKSSIKFKELFHRIHRQLSTDSQCKLKSRNTFQSFLDKEASRGYILKSPTQRSIKRPLSAQKRSQSAQKRPRSARVMSAPRQPKYSDLTKKFMNFLQQLAKEVHAYLASKTDSQIEQLSQEFGRLQQLCRDIMLRGQVGASQNFFMTFQDGISKKLQHRLSRVMFYLIYSKFLETISAPIDNQLNCLTMCEYYSRDLMLYSCTLNCCFKIQKVLSLGKYFQTSKNYCRKCLKLAIYLKDKDAQFEAIEALKYIGYYTGALLNDKDAKVTQDERNMILKSYNPKQDMPNLNFKLTIEYWENHCGLEHTFESYKFELEFGGGQKLRHAENARQFVSKFAFIQKQMTELSQNVMKTVRKVSNVGKVRKYLSPNNFISLHPSSPNLAAENREQIFLTHKRRPSTELTLSSFFKIYLPQIEKRIFQLAFRKKISKRQECPTRRKRGKMMISFDV